MATTFLELEDERTIVKRLFVETYPFQKMFEVYIMTDKETYEKGSKLLCHGRPKQNGFHSMTKSR